MNFEPALGGEIRKKRPAIIITNSASAKYLNRVQVAPLTSNVDQIYPSEAYVTLNGRQNKATGDQLTTVSKLCLMSRAGTLSAEDTRRVEQAVKVQLGLE